MNRLAYLQHRISPPFSVVAFAYILYVVVFAVYHDYARVGLSSLAVIPVIAASWYFGLTGGILMTMLSILATVVILIIGGYPQDIFVLSNFLRILTLILVAVIVGRLGAVTRERREALIKLEKYEKERQTRLRFLERLNEITKTALETNNLESTLKYLIEQITELFEADDCFFASWDEDRKQTTPILAYGSMSEIYPGLRFEPGERTLASAVMEIGHPLAIRDLKSSPLISPKIASLFPSRSMLGIPLIVQGSKVASLYLGYNTFRDFDPAEIAYAESAAQQIALVLTKIRLLEDTQKQVKKLTILHEVALVSTQVESIDQLIERVTGIIGKNLFPNNFGVLLMDEVKGVLRPHASYRFGSTTDRFPAEIPLGQGVTGQVAQTGQPIRLGNVRGVQNYLDVDRETASELCVPIKLKDRVLGVVNTESSKTDAFSRDDELLLGTLAGQLATAIEQLRAAAAERQWLNQLAHSNELIYALAHITAHIEKALGPDELLEVLGRELKQLKLTCAIAMYDSHRKSFTFDYTSLESDLVESLEDWIGFPLAKYPFSVEKMNLQLNAQRLSQPAVISNPEDEIKLLFDPTQKRSFSRVLERIGLSTEETLIRLPLLFEEKLLGILWLWGKDITSADLPVLSIFARQIAISLEHARLFQEVQSLAATDSLTGLHNRRNLFELGRIEFSRALRMQRPFCCMMLDLDFFKEINDNYGHLIGDQVIREVAARCKSLVREMDLIGRYGGEELTVFLPETDSETAMQVAERLRAAIEKTPMRISGGELNVTVSIGVSRKDDNTLELETLVARADQAMYIAKHKGRNRVAISI